MKKTITTLLATALLVSSLTACAPKKDVNDNSSNASSENTAKEPTTVTMTRWGDVSETDIETQLVKKFNEENKDIQIDFQPIPGDGYGEKLMANFAAGTACDLFLIGEGDYRMYYSKGVVSPLNEFIEKDKSFDVKSYSEGLINSATFDQQLCYLPAGFNPIALFYNKDIFDKYKVAYPNDKWTWDDLEVAAKKMTKAETKEYGFYADAWDYATQVYLKSFGVEIGSEDATKAVGYLNSDEAVELVTNYTNYILKDKISPSSSAAESFGGATSMFQTGQIAMMVSGGWNRNPLNKAGTNYGTAMIPMGKDGVRGEIICSASLAIYSKSKVKEQAWEVIKFITGKESSNARYEATADLPAHQEQLATVKAKDAGSVGLIDMMQYGSQSIRQKGDMGQYFSEFYNAAFEEILIANKDPKEALDKAAKAIEAKIADEKK